MTFKLKNNIITTKQLLHILLMCVLCLLSAEVKAQTTLSKKSKQKIDSLILAKPQTYDQINTVVKYSKKDTLLLRYFAARADKSKYFVGASYAYNQLGTVYRNLSQYKKAIQLHKLGLEASTLADNIEFKVYSLNMLGVDYRRIDAIRTALDYNQQALELAESVKKPSKDLKRSINVSLNSIGNLYHSLEQYNLAINRYNASLKIEEELGNKLGLAINYQNIGEALEEQGKLEEALEKYRTSLAYNEEIDSDKGQVICNNSIAQVYLKQNKTKKAIVLLETALVGAKQIGDKYITAFVEANMGWAYMQLNKIEKAENHIKRSLEIGKDQGIPRIIALGTKRLSELEQLKGNHDNALTYYKRAIELEKKISSTRNIRYANDVILRYENEKINNEIENLRKDNEIVKLKLKKNRATLLIIGISLVLLMVVLFVFYKQNQLTSDKKMLTLEQTMLRSQMNPHFLFNSLNSIKLYIINNEKKNAVHYLNKFSKLVRKILEASSLREISLEDELETVSLYMHIENIRFSNKIDFTVDVDRDVDVNQVKIPSLILQPFLENALWHGLSSKKGNKKIHLHISKQDEEFIIIRITDNGIGRAASEKIKEAKVLKRKSLGIDITKERLKNFSKDYLNSFKVEFIDLKDEGKKALGTEVILTIPII
ncbi:tetratricopeptide repeat protein [Cellulophaga lytica]|uniref:Signal transduction histidine kinase, LytS n=1 Tax=Cellulophaga lytica (strain ATCC 23178 / DSM 7489 / JCM 8516 / NBRC 14961 / NCIMB 1423 / VKM B-1433 / Cy l20) TaxID=867900 RepID=F0RAU2_CELLC|nr:tetratricopeptide repeat protein [Cellulophaga lytica]ADY29498.1 signal transduction histidine kinase, LytS [Cellulophaga lytica DSM 7489]AIM60508.1 histidine kinase [Cellulophaga lytica]WQG76328.1 tetratricopeptide repeat protein [Cellulophaga lytica]